MNFFKNLISAYKKLEGNKYFETTKVVIISLAIILPVRTYLMEPFYVKGSSMEPNFHDYDYLLINKFKYRLGEIERQDVIVAKFSPEKPYVIKRVIGLPGETLEIDNGKISITSKDGNQFELEEEYLEPSNIKKEDFLVKIPEDEYVLMGDNRAASYDSRQQGAIAKKNIKGKLMLKVFNFEPLAKIFNKINPFYKDPLTI